MKKYTSHTLLSTLLLCIYFLFWPIHLVGDDKKDEIMKSFLEIISNKWKLVMHDPCTRNWKKNWELDGLKAKITNNSNGMDFWAGPIAENDACHTVLWTKQSFKGDLKIEYDYTRLDEANKYVTILYIQATGSNIGPYKKDIAEWAHLRDIPAMRIYFDNMNTYHISYAVNSPEKDYIRARRYMPKAKKGLIGTSLEPDYTHTGFFKTGVPHRITVIKKKNDLYMYIRNAKKELLCHWTNSVFPPIVEGRIGLRHMYTRGARYSNFRIYLLKDDTKKSIEQNIPDNAQSLIH